MCHVKVLNLTLEMRASENIKGNINNNFALQHFQCHEGNAKRQKIRRRQLLLDTCLVIVHYENFFKALIGNRKPRGRLFFIGMQKWIIGFKQYMALHHFRCHTEGDTKRRKIGRRREEKKDNTEEVNTYKKKKS